MSNRQIAYTLYLSDAAVKRHLANVCPKVVACSRGEAVKEVLARGWLTPKTSFRRGRALRAGEFGSIKSAFQNPRSSILS
jgi:hypothetical protein